MGKVLVIKGADFSTNRVEKIDFVTYTNLINPATLTADKYIFSNGSIKNATDANIYCISDYIAVNGQNITAFGTGGWASGSIATANVYDSNKNRLRTLYGTGTTNPFNYTYQEGDCYIILGLVYPRLTDNYPTFFACYGDELLPYKPYEAE